jgi:hypothetical protein
VQIFRRNLSAWLPISLLSLTLIGTWSESYYVLQTFQWIADLWKDLRFTAIAAVRHFVFRLPPSPADSIFNFQLSTIVLLAWIIVGITAQRVRVMRTTIPGMRWRDVIKLYPYLHRHYLFRDDSSPWIAWEVVVFGLGALMIVSNSQPFPTSGEIFHPFGAQTLILSASTAALMILGLYLAGRTLVERIWLSFTICAAVILVSAAFR